MNKGFTIVELIVTVSIIALLTAITVSNLASSKAKARDGKRISDIVNLQFALELFFDRCNQYPTRSGALPNLDANNGCPTGVTLRSFISRIPTPPGTDIYAYGVNNETTPTDYVLQADLELYNQALIDDVDGVQNYSGVGFDCEDSPNFIFCVLPK